MSSDKNGYKRTEANLTRTDGDSSLWNAREDKHLRTYRFALIAGLLLIFFNMIGRLFIPSPWVYGFDVACLTITIILMITLYNRVMKRFEYRVNEQAVGIATEYQQYMNQWQTPYVMLDNRLRVVWYNDAFRKIMTTADPIGFTPDEMGIQWGNDKPDWDPIQKVITLDNAIYRVLLSQIRLRDKNEPASDTRSYTLMYGMSFTDITREKKLEQENLDQQTVVTLLYIDNYDQIVSIMDEGEKPVMEAAVYRQLSDLAADLAGVINRLERDRFMIQFPRRSLKKLCETRKFDILENVKKIESGSRYRITLSIGVGVDKDLQSARRYASGAIELAMGRGGDQAVVKYADTQQFFGGMSASTESNTRVRARLIALALKERIEAFDRVLIMGHNNPDLDCLGSALGVYRMCIDLKKPANIVISEKHHSAITYLYDLVKNDPDHAGAMIDHDEALELISDKTLLIIVDVNRSVIVQYPDILEKMKDVVVIDHHRAAADHINGAVISYVEPFASSASEMVTELLQYMLEKPKFSGVEIDGMLAGIMLDTKNFVDQAGVRTFEAAAYLRRRGADIGRVRKMFKNDMDEYKAKSNLIAESVMIYPSIAYAQWQADMSNAVTVAAQAADDLLDIRGVDASFVVTGLPGGKINISARSQGNFNVQLVMEALGGGGHHSAAGAQMQNISLDGVRDRIDEAIGRVAGLKHAPEPTVSGTDVVQ
ncbi:MAG: DHH family phosphoesterase [Lachnospiraceae bacterium]|nr:DHH family phosphoesterase [Lachnospiraceae bacterium]